MKLYNTTQGILATDDDRTFHALLLSDWDELVTHPDLHTLVRDSLRTSRISSATPTPAPTPDEILPPIGTQEVWAAGVTYFRSPAPPASRNPKTPAAAPSTTASTTPNVQNFSSRPPPTASSAPAATSASAATPHGPSPSPNSPCSSTPRARSSATPSATT